MIVIGLDVHQHWVTAVAVEEPPAEDIIDSADGDGEEIAQAG